MIDGLLFTSTLEVLGIGLVLYFWGTDKLLTAGTPQNILGWARWIRRAGVIYTILAGILALLFVSRLVGVLA